MKGKKKKRGRSKNEPKKPFELNAFHVVGIGLVMALWAAFLHTHSYRGVWSRLGLLGSYTWVLGMGIAFALRIIYLARFVLPPDAGREESDRPDPESRERGWREGLRLVLLSFVTSGLLQRLQNIIFGPASAIPEGLPPSFGLFRSGIIDSHLALILARENEFTRAVGPGYIRLNRGERISHVIDLRRHSRKMAVPAISRDGIPLQATIRVAFQIRRSLLQPEEEQGGHLPYSYHREAILRLAYAESLSGGINTPWTERIVPLAATHLVTQLARYRLDQLYVSVDQEASHDIVPLSRIEERIKEDLERGLAAMFDSKQEAGDCPVEILRIRLGPISPPPEIVEQRIQTWQTELQRRIALRQAEGEAEEIRSLKTAQARAQLEMLENLTENIVTMYQAYEANLDQIVMLRMIEAMDEAMAGTDAAGKFPAGMMTTLNQLNNWLRRLPAGQGEKIDEQQ